MVKELGGYSNPIVTVGIAKWELYFSLILCTFASTSNCSASLDAFPCRELWKLSMSDLQSFNETFTTLIFFQSLCDFKSRKENPQKLTQLSSRSHPRHLVGKRTA